MKKLSERKMGIPKKPKQSKPMKPQGNKKPSMGSSLIGGLAGHIMPKSRIKTVNKKGLKITYSDGSSKTVILKPMKQKRIKNFSI
jgi:hypothetical protein